MYGYFERVKKKYHCAYSYWYEYYEYRPPTFLAILGALDWVVEQGTPSGSGWALQNYMGDKGDCECDGTVLLLRYASHLPNGAINNVGKAVLRTIWGLAPTLPVGRGRDLAHLLPVRVRVLSPDL